MSWRRVSACFHPAAEDAAPVERAGVTRSEALALVDLFWAEVAAAQAGRFPSGSEITLSFSRDPEDDFIEVAVFDPARFAARHHYVHAWKLLGIVPMKRRTGRSVPIRTREQLAALVEAYLAAPDPGRFGEHMVWRGAGARADLQ